MGISGLHVKTLKDKEAKAILPQEPTCRPHNLSHTNDPHAEQSPAYDAILFPNHSARPDGLCACAGGKAGCTENRKIAPARFPEQRAPP